MHNLYLRISNFINDCSLERILDQSLSIIVMLFNSTLKSFLSIRSRVVQLLNDVLECVHAD